MNNARRRFHAVLPVVSAILLVGILFPMAWLTQFSEAYHWVFGALFGSLWMHILMHAGLFAALACVLATLWRVKAPHTPPARVGLAVLTLVVVIGLAQEGLQLLYKGRAVALDDLLDVGVDLVGGTLGTLVAHWIAHRSQLGA